MVTFTVSPTQSTVKFSAKSNIIVLPKVIEKFTEEEQCVIKDFCLKARDLYVKKVVSFTTNTMGKRICAIQVKQQSMQEAIQYMQETITPEVFDPIYTRFQALAHTVLDKPKPKSSTNLDRIES